jgi:hypothetical protein
MKTNPETVFIRGEGGAIFEMSLPLSEAIEERLTKGYLRRVQNAAGDPWDGKEKQTVPPPYATKIAWVSWAVYNGMDPDDADALTRRDLIEKYGVTS